MLGEQDECYQHTEGQGDDNGVGADGLTLDEIGAGHHEWSPHQEHRDFPERPVLVLEGIAGVGDAGGGADQADPKHGQPRSPSEDADHAARP
jgi:hypothetical protein